MSGLSKSVKSKVFKAIFSDPVRFFFKSTFSQIQRFEKINATTIFTIINNHHYNYGLNSVAEPISYNATTTEEKNECLSVTKDMSAK